MDIEVSFYTSRFIPETLKLTTIYVFSDLRGFKLIILRNKPKSDYCNY